MGRWALDVAFVWKAVLTLGLVLLYYCFSIGITFYNKWLTKSFHFPLFMTMLHLAVIFLFSALSRALVQCSSHRARVVLSWADYLRRVAPTALATALDVGLSNWSFLYVTVSLPHSSTWRVSPWCWGPRSSVAFAGPSPRCSCRRLNLASRIPSTPCSTCSHSCSWGFSLSLLYLKVSICPHLRKSSVSRTQGCSCG
ncbi:SLC35C2 isoform 10, partial [Pongo abelii]